MSSYPGPLACSSPGSRGAAWAFRLLLVIAASGLTAAMWFGASAGSSRHAGDASPAATDTRVRIALPAVVVTGSRERANEVRSQVVAGTSSNCGPASAAWSPQ